MDKTMAGVLGAISALAVTPLAAQAAAAPQPAAATSYADLLSPVPNAVELLAAERDAPAEIEPVQYYNGYGNYDYRNHHHWHGHYYHHHHHHHHHHGYTNGYYGYGYANGGYYGR